MLINSPDTATSMTQFSMPVCVPNMWCTQARDGDHKRKPGATIP
jgi:hypothetical protein